jgi:hypothetical protein
VCPSNREMTGGIWFRRWNAGKPPSLVQQIERSPVLRPAPAREGGGEY